MALPADWTVGSFAGNPQYRDPDTGRVLRVETGTGAADPVADRRRQARSFAQRHPSYREIAIRPVQYRGSAAADWEFTYEGRHVLNRVFVVDGRGHSLFLQAPQGDASLRSQFEQIAGAFRPAVG
ncbi:MAG: hypothetical protein M3P46_06345 [Actinomycetota bacterium]|nr:hypothetical protein [Actinomycetota bacterium]